MAVTCDELVKSRSASLGKQERKWVIKGTGDEAIALSKLLTTANAVVNGMKRVDSQCSVEEADNEIYVGSAVYLPDGTYSAVGQFSISFDISGQNQRITQSLSTVSRYSVREGQPVISFDGAINVNADGTVEGVDISIPYMTFQLQYTVDPSDITDAYVEQLGKLVGTMNNAPFKGFDEHELLATGASGSRRDSDNWDLQLKFAVSKNRTDLSIGNTSDIVKDGWDYMWVYYDEFEDTSNHVIIKRPMNVFIERVYRQEDFGLFGLP